MRPEPDVALINRALRGFTELRSFALTWIPESSTYLLALTLAGRDESTLTLLCHDVQNLELNPSGEGFEQMLQLRVEDSGADGLDRIHFTIDELEREALFLHCARVELLP